VVGPVVQQAPLAVRYEASVAMPAKEFADLKAHQMHYKPSNLALQREARQWPSAARVQLPAPDIGELDRPWEAGGTAVAKLTPESLSLLLMAVAGLRGTEHAAKVQRWTASGGNIGSGTAYVVVRDCPGLEPGVYGYVSTAHRLARLRTELPSFAGDDPVTLILTGDYRKVAEKYAAFALRILFLDSGCAQATARVVAGALSLPLTFVDSWDDRAIGAALGLDLDIEPVTAVAALGGAR
jgi:SagB-type dehydrogenase family enzyme